MSGSLFLVTSLGLFFLFFISFVKFSCVNFSFSYNYFYYYYLETCLLFNERQKEVDPDGKGGGEDLREVKGWESIIYIYNEKKSICNKRKKVKIGKHQTQKLTKTPNALIQ